MNKPHLSRTTSTRFPGRGLATHALVALALAACTPAWAGTLEGTATYRERIALPPDAVFEVVLQDVLQADAPAKVLGRASLDPAGQPPFNFVITYDDAAAPPGRRYAVRATVKSQGRLLFTTDRVYPVLEGSDAPLRMRLVAAGAEPQPSAQPGSATGTVDAPAAHEGKQPALTNPRLALTGMFTYLADAATITLCADNRRLPVAMEGDYKALEAAYLKERQQPGQALLVSFEGRIAPRAAMEASQPPQLSVVVERFMNIWPRETCGNPRVDSPFHDTYWKLVRLGETPVPAAEKQREPHLIFASHEPHVSGSGGCNRVMGGFELDGDKLRFGHLASTMMACPTGMEQEQRFLQSLEQVERYRISGSHLELLDGAGAVIARFEAVELR